MEASTEVSNSNKDTASNQPETGPNSTVSRSHPNNNRANTVSNPRPSSLSMVNSSRVMDSKDSTANSSTVSNLNKGSRVVTESRQHLRVPASLLRVSSSTVSSKATAANRARTKGMANSKVRGMASRETRARATVSSRVARTRGMASSRVKDTVASSKTRVTVNKVVKEAAAREDPMLVTRAEGRHMVTTSPETITREETVLRPTEVAEDLTAEMTAEATTTEGAEEMTEEVTVATAEEAVTWTDKGVTTGEMTTEVTVEEGTTTGKVDTITVETEATTQMEMIIRAAGHKRRNRSSRKCRAGHPVTPFSSADCRKM